MTSMAFIATQAGGVAGPRLRTDHRGSAPVFLLRSSALGTIRPKLSQFLGAGDGCRGAEDLLQLLKVDDRPNLGHELAAGVRKPRFQDGLDVLACGPVPSRFPQMC